MSKTKRVKRTNKFEEKYIGLRQNFEAEIVPKMDSNTLHLFTPEGILIRWIENLSFVETLHGFCDKYKLEKHSVADSYLIKYPKSI